MTTPDHPGVVTYPPVIFAGFFAAGLAADRLFPASFGLAAGHRLVGGTLAAAAIVIAALAIAAFARARTHLDVRKPAVALVTTGPYRFSRNPMYLAAVLLYAGAALWLDKPWTLAALVPCLLVMEFGVIRREERYLDGKFGERYRAYRASVRRWI